MNRSFLSSLAAVRTRSSPGDTLARLGVRRVLVCSVFSSVPSLRSTRSTLLVSDGTEGSNPVPSSGESGTNSVIGSTQGPRPRSRSAGFLLGGGAARAVRIERAGRAAGYAYISAEGQVGPLAIAPDADAKAVVIMALRCALEGRPSKVSMIVPGRADVVMRAVLALG